TRFVSASLQVFLKCPMLGCAIPTLDILFGRPRQRFGYFSCFDLTTGQISWYRTGREPESSARETSSSTRKTNFVLDAQTKIVSDVNRFVTAFGQANGSRGRRDAALVTGSNR